MNMELLESTLLLNELHVKRVSTIDKAEVDRVIKGSLAKKLPKLKEKFDFVKSPSDMSSAEKGRLAYTLPEKREYTVSAGSYSGGNYGGSTSSVGTTIVTKRTLKVANGVLCAFYYDDKNKLLKDVYVLGRKKKNNKLTAIRLFWRLHNKHE
jgi:hypothetical protein